MSLSCDTVKELFLHIACFFVGIDVDYVVKTLELDYLATSGINTLYNRCLISVSPNKKLMMHRLLQEMGKNVVCQESAKLPAKRSRVWLSSDSYKILSDGKSSELKTDALKNMDSLKLLQLNFVELNGSYDNFSKDLRWLCWLGFHLRILPPGLFMGNLVAIDMSYSSLEVSDPPTAVIQSLKILNLKDSQKLIEICNIIKIPNLETLILWNCFSLVKVCKAIGDLSSLALLNMTGCKNLSGRHLNLFAASLQRLFLKDCNLDCAYYFPLTFSSQRYLQYLNLGNSLFESLPCYNHLENLRVLDLSFCYRLKCLCLPGTLAELYIFDCRSLVKITFQSHRFTLQEFGYEGCINLYEVEGFIKLVPIAKLDETDLGHMKWLQDYRNHEVCLVGDDELTLGRSWHIQMLYEFGIMSISLPDIKDPNMISKYISESSSLTFDIPSCPESKTLEGINVTFKYTISGEGCVSFCKISTSNGVVDLMYNPKVFGKPEVGKVCVWLSYWPIGSTLDTGDTVQVSIVVMSGMEVHECGVSLVYSDQESWEYNMGWEEVLGGDLSGFELSTGSYYLCRCDFFELMEVGRLTPDWFRNLAGETIDYNEVRGWRKTGWPKQVNDPSFIELKTVRCIIHGPQLEESYHIAEMSKSSIDAKSAAFTLSLLEGEMKSNIRSELDDESMDVSDKKEIRSGDEIVDESVSSFDRTTVEESDPYSREQNLSYNLQIRQSDPSQVPKFGRWDDDSDSASDKTYPYKFNRIKEKEQKESKGISKAFVSDEIKESDSPPHEERLKSVVESEVSGGQEIKKIVLSVNLSSQNKRSKMMKALKELGGIESIDYDKQKGKLTVIGDVDPETLITRASTIADINFSSVRPASERLAEEPETEGIPSDESQKDGEGDKGPLKNKKSACSVM